MKEEKREDGSPIPHYIYINKRGSFFWATDEWGREFNGENSKAECKQFEEPCSGHFCLYQSCLWDDIKTMKQIIKGTLSESMALVYMRHDIPLIQEIAYVIVRFGKDRIKFREDGQKVYVKKTGIKGWIQKAGECF